MVAGILSNLRNTVIVAFVFTLVVFVVVTGGQTNEGFAAFVLRWLHVVSGIMWVGLLWYFNFVQIPSMPKIPDELKGAVTRFIAPQALFWFRWGAMSTLFFGIILAAQNGYLLEAYTLDSLEGFINYNFMLIGIGMWLGTIMWFNVWFVIWPNQQKVLNIGNAYPDLPADQKAKAAKIAGQASRINTMLSIPMLFCMAAASHLA